MGLEQANFYCPQCRQPRLFTRQGINHVFHLIASLFLCGTWLFVWLLIAMSHSANSYFCQVCGYSDTPKYLTTPGLRKEEQLRSKERSAAFQELLQKFANHPHSMKYAIGLFILCAITTIVLIAVKSDLSSSTPQSAPPMITPSPSYSSASEKALREFLGRKYGLNDFYTHMRNIAISGNVVNIQTDLAKGSPHTIKVCEAVSDFVFDKQYNQYGLNELQIYGTGNTLLFSRLSVKQKCR